jgi:amino acid transporter
MGLLTPLAPSPQNPIKQLRRNAFIALSIVTVLYILANIAYFAAIPKADLAASKQIAASLFFTRVFGESNAIRGLNFLIALSAFGNIVAVALGSSRMIRECGRFVVSHFFSPAPGQ